MIKRIFFLAFALLCTLLFATSVRAQGTLPAGFTDAVTVAPAASGYYISSFSRLINSALKYVAYVSGIVLFVYLVWGGTEWMISGGDKAKVEAGRTKITQSIIGLAILASVFVGYVIVLNFLGLRSQIGIGGFAGGTGPTIPGSGGGPVTNPPPGNGTAPTATSCANNVAVGSFVNDGGSGGYCTNGAAATVKCMAPGTGNLPASNVAYYEPCSCTGNSQPAYFWPALCPN